MKRTINTITALDLLFLLLLCISALLGDGMISDAVYYLAFLIPLAIGAYYIKRERPITEEPRSIYLSLNKEGAVYTLPLIAISISAIVAISALTALIMSAFGHTNDMTVSESLPVAVLIHALIPAVLEEFLFRYLPLKLLLPYSRSAAVMISSVYFALIHMNLFQIPYALVAGIIFALIDVRCQSVIPSLIIHFINNVVSLLLILAPSAAVTAAIYGALGVLLLISLCAVIVKRRRYADIAEPILERAERQPMGYAPFVILIFCLSMAISTLLI